MKPLWGVFWQKSSKWLKTGWLIAAGLSALYFGTMRPYQSDEGIAAEKGTGLAGPGWEPISLWRESSYRQLLDAGESQVNGVTAIVGGTDGTTVGARGDDERSPKAEVASARF